MCSPLRVQKHSTKNTEGRKRTQAGPSMDFWKTAQQHFHYLFIFFLKPRKWGTVSREGFKVGNIKHLQKSMIFHKTELISENKEGSVNLLFGLSGFVDDDFQKHYYQRKSRLRFLRPRAPVRAV